MFHFAPISCSESFEDGKCGRIVLVYAKTKAGDCVTWSAPDRRQCQQRITCRENIEPEFKRIVEDIVSLMLSSRGDIVHDILTGEDTRVKLLRLW